MYIDASSLDTDTVLRMVKVAVQPSNQKDTERRGKDTMNSMAMILAKAGLVSEEKAKKVAKEADSRREDRPKPVVAKPEKPVQEQTIPD